MPHGVHQVRLAEAGVTVDEQRIEGLSWRLGHGQGGGMGQLVVGADDEVFEGVAGIERAGVGALFIVTARTARGGPHAIMVRGG
jgi:hypothetical protein